VGTFTPDAVKRLADHFDQNREVFLSDHYKEEQLRAAGLTVRRSTFGVRTFLKPVIHEESIKVAGATKATDCILRIGGCRDLNRTTWPVCSTPAPAATR
jgi:hypothetical protein